MKRNSMKYEETERTDGKGMVFEIRRDHKNPLWNVSAVACFLGVPERTVRDLVYRRAIPFRKVGRTLRFSPEEIEKWTLPKKKE